MRFRAAADALSMLDERAASLIASRGISASVIDVNKPATAIQPVYPEKVAANSKDYTPSVVEARHLSENSHGQSLIAELLSKIDVAAPLSALGVFGVAKRSVQNLYSSILCRIRS